MICPGSDRSLTLRGDPNRKLAGIEKVAQSWPHAAARRSTAPAIIKRAAQLSLWLSIIHLTLRQVWERPIFGGEDFSCTEPNCLGLNLTRRSTAPRLRSCA